MQLLQLIAIILVVVFSYKTYVYFRRKSLINKYPLLFDPRQWKKGKGWYVLHETLGIDAYIDDYNCYKFCYSSGSEELLKLQFSYIDRLIILNFLNELRDKKIKSILEQERRELLRKGSTFKTRCTLQGDTKEVKTISDFLERDLPIEVLEENLENIHKKETT